MPIATPSPEIFKAYDIRGLYGEQIDGDVAELIGRAFARVLAGLAGKPVEDLRVGLGRDMRLTAPELAGRYREGLVAEGAHVMDAGQVGTEMLYFLVGSRGLDGGLMCTASHNPKAYTGAKLVREGALALSGESGIQDIRRLIEAGLDAPGDGASSAGPAGTGVGGAVAGRVASAGESVPRGTVEEVDISAEFREAVLRFIDPAAGRSPIGRPLKVVVDGGNGMAGPMVGPLLEGLGLELIETYWTPDGNFPDHEPNPLLPENRQFLIDNVRESGADLGIAWDGDADRCFFIDDTGSFVDGDFLTALLAESLLRKRSDPTHPEAILYDVRASRAVPDTVTRAGGVPYVNRVGHAFFKTRMRAEGSLFGGEVSGHYYFRDFYCADSGTLPALLILEHLSNTGKRMSELLAPYRERYFISGEINSEVADQDAKMREIAARYADARQQRLDGISIDYEDWHFNVRPSNTEPLLRLCLESLRSHEDMERRRDEVLALIRS
ncbi:MAG TPA: phosphomannomutase/phosphoglucomutase [Solirubrobacteraceae bacterium]|jgi:phosphomannomutase|nr:phosphomannomutase/phosphoglucomutase [Solirubrobacteraceae bacterium]